ncbi:MAG: PAS domain S-box protein [Nitrospiraceae bacterium]|nr:MAG: PAS domain S-box protein [Nitrospiraceae bacterium]
MAGDSAMNSLALFSSRRAAIAFILVLLLFFLLLDFFVTSSVRTRMLDDLQQRFNTELNTIGLFVREPLISSDYARVEQFLLKWADEDAGIVDMKAIMPNNFVLARYNRPELSSKTVYLEHRVRFLEKDLVTIILSRDVSGQELIIRNLRLKLAAGSIVITAFLGLVLWGMMKKTAFQPLQNELDRRKKDETVLREARDELEDRVRERTKELNSKHEALQKSEERFRSLVETTSDWIWEVNENAVYTYSSPRVREILGYAPGDVLGKRPFDLMPEDEARRVERIFRDIAASRKPFSWLENININKKGHNVYLETSGVPVFDDDGRFRGYRGIDRDITGRRESEKALRDSEERYRTLAEYSLFGIWQITPEGHTLFINPAMCRMLEIERADELTGVPYNSFFTEKSLETVKEEYRKRLAGKASQYEVELIGKKGRHLYVVLNGAPLMDAEGNLQSLIGTFVDITERRKTEQALKESEQYLRTIIETEPECVKVIAQDGTLVTMNPAGLAMIEADSLEQVAGKSLGHLLTPEYRERFHSLNQSVLSGNRENLEFEITGLKGGRRWLHMHAVPLRTAGGDIIGVLGVTKDITDKKKAEDKIRLSEEKFSKAFRSSPTFITISTLDEGTYIDVNDAFIQASGYTRAELVGHSALELGVWVNPSDRDEMLSRLREQGSVRNMETRLRMKNGEVVTVLYSAECMNIERRPCILSVKLDITGRKMLESQLLHAQKLEAVGQLAGGVAHDFNNVLTAIISNGYLLKGRLKGNDEAGALADRIITLSNNAARVVQELLLFSRKKKVEMSFVHINEVFRGVGTLLGDFMGRGIEITERYTDRHLYVMADRVQLEQVIINLATNARDAMPNGGRLTIETNLAVIDSTFIGKHGMGSQGTHVLLAVSDSGTGMDRATVERIFEPFFTTKEVGKGPGLGLSIVYGIIQQHRGFILVDSKPGQGTSFRIYLPLAEPGAGR